jgi:glycosyltransferase involved in cell wall biosynthesis
MKLLFLGVYRDGTGWGHAAIDYILALDKAGVDVVCRPIKLNNIKFPIPQRIAELEAKPADNCDVCIQHILPHMMEHCGDFKACLGMFELETSSMIHTFWPEHINLMDAALLTSSHAKKICEESDVIKPQHVILHATDVEKYERDYTPLDIPGTDGEFIFYTIGEMNNRKNIGAIIRAFHTYFDPSEPVSLVIKCSKYGLRPEDTLAELKNHCNKIKEGLKLYPKMEYYKPEILITNVVEDELIYRLHTTCDCFVSASCGEAWCIPAFDAMGFGKTPIVTNWGGFTDYITSETGWLVDSYMQQAFGGGDSFQSIYTGRERWAVVDVDALGQCMRIAYEKKESRNWKAEKGKAAIKNFSHEVIGLKLRGVLEQYV